MIEFSNYPHTQKFIRQIVLVFRFLYFKFFEGISHDQFVTPSEAWHDNSDIVWRKKISLNKKKKQCVESFNIDCLLAWEWPTATGSPAKRRLTNARRNFISTETNRGWPMRCYSSECFWLVETSFTFEIMNIWKSYMWTAECRIIWRNIIAVLYTTYAVAKTKPE